jgi:hypothetical protein
MRSLRGALVFLIGGSTAAFAQPAVVRLGTHNGYGRIVFEFPQPTEFTTERVEDTVVLHFPNGGDVPAGIGTTRNVTGVTGGADTATVSIVPGARMHVMRLGNRVVLDVLDPAPVKRVASRPASAHNDGKPARPPVSPASPVSPVSPVSVVSPTPVPVPVQPTVEASQLPPPPAAAPPPRVEPLPLARPASILPTIPSAAGDTLALAASRTPMPAGRQGSAVILPFASNVAAAAFRHGTEAWIVFDDRRPIDMVNLSDDAVFKTAVIELLPSATLMRFKLPASSDVRLERRTDGWAVIAADATTGPIMMPVTRLARLLLPASSPGQVVVIPDPETGRNLLVGTLKLPGPGVPVAIRVPEFAIRPSWQGVVVEPVSDRTSLRSVPEGFVIETGGALSPMSDNGPALEAAASLTRRFDFPAEPVTSLLRRLQAQIQDVGQAPPQARLALRKAAAQTMLAIGLDAEAQSLLQLAVEEDPRGAADPDISGLSGIAALLSGRPLEADGLDAPGLSGSDEVALWRAVRAALKREDSPEAAPVFAATAGLILSYPSSLRSRLLPLAAETMAEGGAPKAADMLLASLPDEPLLALARAIRLEQKGDAASALTIYDALALGRDRLASARAATRAVMLRLATGALTPAAAAAALERDFMLWRGDARERDLRLQTAAIEAKAGEWRKAIATLKETAQLFPADTPIITAQLATVLSDLLHGPGAASIAPLDLVALADENADAIAQGDAAGMGLLLADKLTALDLPKRADPVIERMAAAAAPGVGRATLGARLAALRFGEADPTGAAKALATTDAPGLPQPLLEERGLLDARIHAQSHDTAGATAILSALGTQAANELRATVLADSGDWHGAALALALVAGRVIPEAGPLSLDQQDLLLRLASVQSHAADEPALRALGLKQAARMSGPRGDMFRLLTASPITGIRDLPRVAGDIALARALPSDLSVLGAR